MDLQQLAARLIAGGQERGNRVKFFFTTEYTEYTEFRFF